MAAIEQVLATLASMPDEALLPVRWVREQLNALSAVRETDPPVYDVASLAKRWARSKSAVRQMLERGEVRGAWKQGGKAWRVNRSAVEECEAMQAKTPLPGRARFESPADPHGLRGAARGAPVTALADRRRLG